MTAKEIHEACVEACEKCPQWEPFEEDQIFHETGYSCYDLYKHGARAVLEYWSKDDTLWNAGYSTWLRHDVLVVLEKCRGISDSLIEEIENA